MRLGLGFHGEQFVAHFGAVQRQVPLAEPRFTATADFQGGGGLVFQADAFTRHAGGRSALLREVLVGTPDHRPRMRRLDGAAEVAVHLQLRVEVITQPDARRVVPIVLAERRLAFGIADLGFAAGVDGGQAGGQPQVRHQFQVVADMQHGVGAQVAVVAGLGAGGIAGRVAGGNAHVLGTAVVGHRLGGAQA